MPDAGDPRRRGSGTLHTSSTTERPIGFPKHRCPAPSPLTSIAVGDRCPFSRSEPRSWVSRFTIWTIQCRVSEANFDDFEKRRGHDMPTADDSLGCAVSKIMSVNIVVITEFRSQPFMAQLLKTLGRAGQCSRSSIPHPLCAHADELGRACILDRGAPKNGPSVLNFDRRVFSGEDPEGNGEKRGMKTSAARSSGPDCRCAILT